MNIFEMDFDELLVDDFYEDFSKSYFNDDEILEMISQADKVIADTSEDKNKQAEAYTIKFQLLCYQYKLAPKLLEKALILHPNMPQALIRMGVFYYHNENNNEKSLEYVNKVIENYPDYACSWIIRASITYRDEEKALSDCLRYIQFKPNHYLGYEACGAFSMGLLPSLYELDKEVSEDLEKDINKVIFYFSEAIRLNPSDIYNYFERGQLYLMKDHLYEREEDRTNALLDIIKFFLMFPDDEINQYITRINNLFNNVKIKLKKIYCSEIIKTISQEKTIYWIASLELADCLCEQNYYQKSIDTYTSIIEKNKKGTVFQLLGFSGRANVYSKINKYEMALDDYAKIIEYYPIVIGKQLLDDKDYYDKIPSAIDPVYVYENRARIYGSYYYSDKYNYDITIENKKRVIIEYSKAIELAKEFQLERCYKGRGDLYVKIDEYDKAIKDYTTIIKMAKKKKASDYFISTYDARIDLYYKKGKILRVFFECLNRPKMKKLSDVFLDNSFSRIFISRKDKSKYKIVDA